jgi:hypothetical protein
VFIVHPVGRGILDAPVNLRSKMTSPQAIISLISFENWKNETFFRGASGMPRPTNGTNRSDKRKFEVFKQEYMLWKTKITKRKAICWKISVCFTCRVLRA